VHIDFLVGQATHHLTIEQSGSALSGMHRGDTLAGALRGSVYGNDVRLRSSQKIQGTSLSFDFKGTADGGTMKGTLALGEYGHARWTATRRG